MQKPDLALKCFHFTSGKDMHIAILGLQALIYTTQTSLKKSLQAVS